MLGRSREGPRQKVGYEYVNSMVDDHTRMAYSEVLDSENAQACAGFMLRAARWFSSYGYRIDRVMTDNAMAYRRSRAFAHALSVIGATHKLIRPYRPQTNGKVERFHRPSYKAGRTNAPTPPTSNDAGPHHSSAPTITTAPQLTRRPTTHHQTCNPPLWEGQLGNQTDPFLVFQQVSLASGRSYEIP